MDSALAPALCLACGIPFPASRHWHSYCSPECRRTHYWKTHATMKLLDTQFKEGNFTFHQIERDVDFALYKKVSSFNVWSYEVIRIRHRPAERVFDRDYPLREVYPASETWGTDGWSFNTMAAARRHYASLTLPPTTLEETPAGAPPANTTTKQN